jgi:8-oxo-dGTP pyrophosphatase MutT (NUDIX family)
MQTKKDTSYGVIPIRRVDGVWQVFLILQFSHIGKNSYWALPKGHPEVGESPQETALRELKEETGLTVQKLFNEPTFDLKYSFQYEGQLIDKTVTFLVGVVNEEEPTLDPSAVKEAGWYTLGGAAERLDYGDTKAMFEQARSYIETL